MSELPETMQALVLAEEERIVYTTVPLPAHRASRRCDCEGHLLRRLRQRPPPYHGREKGLAPNTIVGHEFVGVVAAKGDEVSGLEVGDRVASPFTSCCGDCFYCRKGATCRSELPATERRGLQGSQAQYVRVPLASGTLVKLPADISDEGGLLVGDILSTAFFCAERGEVGEGATVLVLGCGPVGLLCVMAAKHLGAGTIFAVDSVPERLAVAQELGARPLRLQPPQPPQPPDAGGQQEAVVAAVREATEGRGVDCVLEAVGANGALRLAYELVRPMGTISSVGVNTSSSFPFSPVDAYNKNVTFRSGRCPARAYMTRLLELVRDPAPQAGGGEGAAPSGLPWRRIITHRMPLSKGPEAYDMFAKRADGCIKVVLDPWA